MVAVTMLISACSQNEPSMSGKKKQLTYAAINLNDTTQDADILVATNDRSYMVCDVNYKDKCGTLFFSVTSRKHLNEGFLIYMDSTGTPMMRSLISLPSRRYHGISSTIPRIISR